CNFATEISVDMLSDSNDAETFVLWSGDSDFAYPLEKLIHLKKKVILFATSGRISSELNDMKENGLVIFEINKIKEFIQKAKEAPLIVEPLSHRQL
ncbi:MAG: NYN domain-containing protein, partial [Patescibacteria group bacterium]